MGTATEVTHALIQVQNPARPLVEARSLLAELPLRGVKTQTFTIKQLQRRRLDLNPHTLVAGDLDAVPLSLRVMGCGGPFLATYPCAVQPFLGRELWESTVGRVMRRVEDSGQSIFLKPKESSKRFTGFVLHSRGDLFHLSGASKNLPVFCSEVVSFVHEYRVYVAHGQVAGVAQYRGDLGGGPPNAFVDDVLEALRGSGELVAGFGLDVGQLDTGDWAVVECNEGFGLGQYPGLPGGAYADVILARWQELMDGQAA